MPPLVIAAAIGAGGMLGAAEMQRRSSNNAAKAQTKANDEALDFTKQQYADAQKQWQPYADISLAALRSGSDFLNSSPYAQTSRQAQVSAPTSLNQLRTVGQAPPAAPPQPSAPPQLGAAVQLVRVIGPDGRARMVPQSAVQGAMSLSSLGSAGRR